MKSQGRTLPGRISWLKITWEEEEENMYSEDFYFFNQEFLLPIEEYIKAGFWNYKGSIFLNNTIYLIVKECWKKQASQAILERKYN